MKYRAPIYLGAAAVTLLVMGWPAVAELRSIDLAISDGQLPRDQRVIAVLQGDELTLRVTTDKPIEIHLHGYDIEEKLSPGAVVSIRFTTRATGRFPLEIHGNGRSGDRVLGYLEVRPR